MCLSKFKMFLSKLLNVFRKIIKCISQPQNILHRIFATGAGGTNNNEYPKEDVGGKL